MTDYTRIEELDIVLTRLKRARTRDEHDDMLAELGTIAPKYIDELDRLYDSNRYDRMPLIWCLIGETNGHTVRLFSKAIKDKDQYTRWAAAIALTKCRTRKASALLVAALKDRSHLVKHVAVDSMSIFRDPAAVSQLQKIVASKHLQKTAPGIVASARKALRVCSNAG